MGKREIGELSILDFVVFIMIGKWQLSQLRIQRSLYLKPWSQWLLLMVFKLFAIVSLKSKKFRDLVDGQPTIIINRGKIDEHAMRKQRYNFDDLMTQLREKDIRSIADVEFAILESSGSLSVIEKQIIVMESRKDGILLSL